MAQVDEHDYIVKVTLEVERINEPQFYSAIQRASRYVSTGQPNAELAAADAMEKLAADMRAKF